MNLLAFSAGILAGACLACFTLSKALQRYIERCYLETRHGTATDFWNAMHRYTKTPVPE